MISVPGQIIDPQYYETARHLPKWPSSVLLKQSRFSYIEDQREKEKKRRREKKEKERKRKREKYDIIRGGKKFNTNAYL